MQLAPDVIVAVFFVAVRALQQETKTVPVVVMGGGDVVENGTVINSARPEGNVTGFTNAFGSLGGKWLELLKEAAPNITRVLHFGNPRSIETRSIETAARSLGVQVVSTNPAARGLIFNGPPSFVSPTTLNSGLLPIYNGGVYQFVTPPDYKPI